MIPTRFWIWRTCRGLVYRFDTSEAEKIATVLDAARGDPTIQPPAFVSATAISGAEVRLQLAFCEVFEEHTAESWAAERALDRELEAVQKADKDWSNPE